MALWQGDCCSLYGLLYYRDMSVCDMCYLFMCACHLSTKCCCSYDTCCGGTFFSILLLDAVQCLMSWLVLFLDMPELQKDNKHFNGTIQIQ